MSPPPSANGNCPARPSSRRRAADVAALAVHLMTNTALTGATYDIDGGEQLVSG